jgi:hypothetical protein
VSHFLTLVLIDPGDPNPAKKAEEIMRRYFDRDMETPDAKCDGFTIGGRYDGDIWGKEQHYNLTPDEFQARYGFDVVKAGENIRPVTMLRPGLSPYAIITPDGRWQDEEGKTEGEWALCVGRLFDRHANQLAVAVDCHC